MKISQYFKTSSKPFPSLEIVPPLSGVTRESINSVLDPLMEFSPKYINVTTHRDEFTYERLPEGTFARKVVRSRVSTVAVCASIQERYKVEVVPHIICAGNEAYEIESTLYDLKYLGIRNVMALRGDSLVGEKRFTPTPGGYTYASELVRAIRSFGNGDGEDFCIGVGGYPEKHFEAANLEDDILHMKAKVESGADYIITQMFFDNKVFYDFVAKCRAAGITVPIIPGIKPLSTLRQVRFLPESFSIDIPRELTSQIEEAKEDKQAIYEIGTLWCIAQCKDLLSHGVPAIHFYTMSRTDNIRKVLEECFR